MDKSGHKSKKRKRWLSGTISGDHLARLEDRLARLIKVVSRNTRSKIIYASSLSAATSYLLLQENLGRQSSSRDEFKENAYSRTRSDRSENKIYDRTRSDQGKNNTYDRTRSDRDKNNAYDRMRFD